MSVLWIAFGIYIVGVAIVLYLRPSTMFHAETGTWKEFGMGRSAHYTLFPIWMFTIVWAFASYALASVATLALRNFALQTVSSSFFGETGEAGTEAVERIAGTPISKVKVPRLPIAAAESVAAPSGAAAAAGATPGYYVLETPKTGPPKYVYFGTSPPSIEDVERFAPGPSKTR
jgi:hypothetical protein